MPGQNSSARRRAARLPVNPQAGSTDALVLTAASGCDVTVVGADDEIWPQQGSCRGGPGGPAPAPRSAGLTSRMPAEVTAGLGFPDAPRGETGRAGRAGGASSKRGRRGDRRPGGEVLARQAGHACQRLTGARRTWKTEPRTHGDTTRSERHREEPCNVEGKRPGLAPRAAGTLTLPCAAPRACTPSSRAAARTPHHCSRRRRGH